MSCYLLMKSALFFRLHAEKQDLCFCRRCFTNHDVCGKRKIQVNVDSCLPRVKNKQNISFLPQ